MGQENAGDEQNVFSRNSLVQCGVHDGDDRHVSENSNIVTLVP